MSEGASATVLPRTPDGLRRGPGATLSSSFRRSYSGKGRQYEVPLRFHGAMADRIQVAADRAGVSSGAWVRMAVEAELIIAEASPIVEAGNG